MTVVGGIIVIVIIVLAAVLSAGSTAKVLNVSDTVNGNYQDTKVQVTGTVVDNSYAVDEKGVLTFRIQDEGTTGTSSNTLAVSYDKGVSSTFGNGITAICTGRIDSEGVLQCTELVTKCPSKYENASDALTVEQLLSYSADTMTGKTVKVSGKVQAGTLASATSAVRFVLADDTDASITLKIVYSGALSDDIKDGSAVVVMGALQSDGSLLTTDVALEG